jgi:hypothetical protein
VERVPGDPRERDTQSTLHNLHSPGKEICVQRRRFNPHRFFYQIYVYASGTAFTIMLLAWLFHEVKHALGF